jgi:hypothetical protein
MCHSCAQGQTLTQAKEHPAPTSLAEYAETVSEEFVDEAGDLRQDKWVQKGTEDLTASWKASVAR